MFPFRHLAPAALLATALASPIALAEGLDAQFSGYGTLAATYADTHDAQFRTSWQQSRGSKSRVDWGVDSRIGAQLDLGFDETFSATGQLLGQRLGANEQLSVEWLYAQAQLNPETVVRAGRVVLTAFMLSDVRNVGYSQHWAHTPYEVYLTFPPIDGVQLLYRSTWQGIRFSVQPTVGRAKADMYYETAPLGVISAPTDFHRFYSFNVMAEKGNVTARLGHSVADATIRWSIAPAEPLIYRFTSLGLQYDDGRWLAMAEIMKGHTDTGRYDLNGQYVSLGHRFGAWMPYATYANLHNTGTAIRAVPDSYTPALGLRWDAAKDMSLKFQAERARFAGQQFIGLTPGTDPSRSARIYTLALDFVF